VYWDHFLTDADLGSAERHGVIYYTPALGNEQLSDIGRTWHHCPNPFDGECDVDKMVHLSRAESRKNDEKPKSLLCVWFTSTPQKEVQELVLNAIRERQVGTGDFLSDRVEHVVLQISQEDEKIGGFQGFEKVQASLQGLLLTIESIIVAREAQEMYPLNFFIWDLCHINDNEDYQPRTDGNFVEAWHTFAFARIEEFSRKYNARVYFIPTVAGESAGVNTVGLMHAKSQWHWTGAGLFYHALAFLNTFGCATSIDAARQ
jgi:hypothetical protein